MGGYPPRLDDFVKLKRYLDCVMAGVAEGARRRKRATPTVFGPVARDRKRYFPDNVYDLFKRVIRTLEREDRIVVSDRKVVKLYRLVPRGRSCSTVAPCRKEDLRAPPVHRRSLGGLLGAQERRWTRSSG